MSDLHFGAEEFREQDSSRFVLEDMSSPRKNELILSFLRSKARGTNQEQLQLSRRCIENRDSITYERVDFYAILRDNDRDYPKIAVAFDFLLKYITNLLPERLPQNWWSINTKLPQFVHRISSVVGAKDVLKTAGYCVEQHGTLSFPEDKRSLPDRQLLSVVSAELLIAKAECERAKQGGPGSMPSPLLHQQQREQRTLSQEEPPGEDRLHHSPSDLLFQSPEPNPYPSSSDKVAAHSDRPGGTHHIPVQASGNFPPTLAPRTREQLEPAHPQLARLRNGSHRQVEESLGFETSPSSSYEHSMGQQDHQEQEPSPLGLSHSSHEEPPDDLVHDIHLTTEQQRQTRQQPSQPLAYREQAMQEEEEGKVEYVEEGHQEIISSNLMGASHHHSSSDEIGQAGSGDEDSSSPDALPSSTPSWKEQSKVLLEIMRQGHASAQRGPHTTAFEVHQPQQRQSSSSSSLTRKPNQTSVYLRQQRDTSPIAEQREHCVRFGQVLSTSRVGPEQRNTVLPTSDPSDPDQMESLQQECKQCKNMVCPGSKCGYCGLPCPKKRTRKIRTAEQLEKPTNDPQELTNKPLSALQTEKTACPSSASSGQENLSTSPLPQASPVQPSPTKASEHTGQPFYPPSYPREGSFSQHKPTSTEHLASSGVSAPEDCRHPTHFDHLPPEKKRREEAEWFCQCSAERQQEYLKEKRGLGDNIDHLLPFCKEAFVQTPPASKEDPYAATAPHCGIESHQKKREAEVEWFRKLSPAKQREVLERKERLNDTVEHLRPHLKQEHVKVGRKMVDEKVMADLEEERKHEQMKKDGAIFVYHIKMCTRHGFAPEEVEIAYKRNRDNPLGYLREQWLQEIERVQLEVRGYKPGGQSIGEPTMNEVRLALIESRGDRRGAIDSCCKKRRAKIHELMSMASHKATISWDEAVEVLTVCNLQVEEAFNELQRRRLQPLYDFIFGDYKAFTKNMTEMDFLKELAIKGAQKEGNEYEAHLRMLTAECKLKHTSKAKLLIQLLKDNSEYPMRYYIDAASNYSTFEDAQRYLNQPCPICVITYPMDEMVVMPGACGHSMCKDCFRGHFEITIKEKSVKHFNCPECGQPDLNEIADFYLELFVALIKEHVNSCYELCQQKLRDYALSKEPGFVWCSSEDCRSGFINERPERYRLDCPTCHKPMCFHCKKPWEPQHEGISCEAFANWKADNDPEAQKAGLAAHLEENGIECPACKMRYDLAQGGCMHFKCTQCPCEFCSGCNKRFKNGKACGRFDSCNTRGLHAHHPRDCLYFLRDFPVADLQKLLTDKTIDFDTEPRQTQIDAQQQQGKQKEQNVAELPPENPEVKEASLQPEVGGGDGEEEDLAIGGDRLAAAAVAVPPADGGDVADEVRLTCCVMLQKEVPNGLVDEKCGKNSPKGMAGLCEVHYKEYLVRKINKNHLDPVELYDLNGVKQILRREEIEFPEQEDDENEVDYRRKLIDQIHEELPIGRDLAAVQ